MIPDCYTVREVAEGWRISSETGWWVEFRTRTDLEELWQGLRYYLDQPPKQSDIN